MDTSKKRKVWIIVLLILLIITVAVLIGVILHLRREKVPVHSVSPGNVLQPQSSSAVFPVEEGAAPRAFFIRQLALSSLTAGPQEQPLTLSGEEGGAAVPFSVDDMMPGDSVTKTFTLTPNESTAQYLIFSAAVADLTEYSENDARKTRSSALMNLSVKLGDSVLYDGPFADVASIPVAAQAGRALKYAITVSLDKKAGNEYADLDLRINFLWTLSYNASVTVTYKDGLGGALFADQVYTCNPGDPTPIFSGALERDGYLFDSWTPSVSPTVEADSVYTAVWIARRKVTFVRDTTSSSVYVNDGCAVSKIAAPSKNGCGFAGWYLDQGYTQKYDFSASVTQDLVLYARFFLWGDVNMDGYVTSFDADLVHAFIVEIPNPSIKNIMASCVTGVSGDITATNADYIQSFIVEAISEFPVERYVGYEYDIENRQILPPIA